MAARGKNRVSAYDDTAEHPEIKERQAEIVAERLYRAICLVLTIEASPQNSPETVKLCDKSREQLYNAARDFEKVQNIPDDESLGAMLARADTADL